MQAARGESASDVQRQEWRNGGIKTQTVGGRRKDMIEAGIWKFSKGWRSRWEGRRWGEGGKAMWQMWVFLEQSGSKQSEWWVSSILPSHHLSVYLCFSLSVSLYPSLTLTTRNLTVAIPVRVLHSISFLPPALIDLSLRLSISGSLSPSDFHSQPVTNNKSQPYICCLKRRKEGEIIQGSDT